MTFTLELLVDELSKNFMEVVKGPQKFVNTMKLVVGLGFDSAMKDVDHDALWSLAAVCRDAVDVKAAIAERELVRDDNKKLCYTAPLTDTKLASTAETDNFTTCELHHHRRRGQIHCLKYCSSEAILVKEPDCPSTLAISSRVAPVGESQGLGHDGGTSKPGRQRYDGN